MNLAVTNGSTHPEKVYIAGVAATRNGKSIWLETVPQRRRDFGEVYVL